MTDKLVLTSVQEAAFNAAGEALIDLGFDCSIGVTLNFMGEAPYFTCAARVPGLGDVYASGGSGTLAGAMQTFIMKANDLIANPPPAVLKDGAAVKEAAKAIVHDARERCFNGDEASVALDEIADRIDKLATKP